MQMSLASGTVTWIRKHMRVVVQTGISLIAAAIMMAAALDAIAAQDSLKREIIPGSELMTSQERERYRQRIRGAKTPAEEEQVRAEHLRQVRERARLRGLRLPESAEVTQMEK